MILWFCIYDIIQVRAWVHSLLQDIQPACYTKESTALWPSVHPALARKKTGLFWQLVIATAWLKGRLCHFPTLLTNRGENQGSVDLEENILLQE